MKGRGQTVSEPSKPILQEAREWADRIDARVIEPDRSSSGGLEVELQEGHYVEVYQSGVVRLRQERMLANGNDSEVSFGDRRLTVEDKHTEHRVSPSEFPSDWE